ncbi:hypothetical protein D9M68_875370 [compost metagenome]
MRAQAPLYFLKNGWITVEPVSIAVEHHTRLRLCGQALFQRGQGLAIAVEAADHIQDLAVEQQLAGEGIAGQAVIQRTVATGAHQALPRNQPGIRYPSTHKPRP